MSLILNIGETMKIQNSLNNKTTKIIIAVWNRKYESVTDLWYSEN